MIDDMEKERRDALRAEKLTDKYEQIMGQVVKMIEEPDKWLIRNK